MLPGTDGIELMKDSLDVADMPVIFLSAYGREELIVRALDMVPQTTSSSTSRRRSFRRGSGRPCAGGRPQSRWVVTEAGERVYPQPEDKWIEVPFPTLVDEETWDRAQALKSQRRQKSNRNTKIFYLLQHLVSCAECGLMFACRSSTHTYFRRKGKVRKQARVTPQRHYHCYGMLREHMDCRNPAMLRAEQLEELVWNQVKGMVQNPELIVAGIESLGAQEDGGLAEQTALAERDLQRIQVEEERAIRLYVSGKITENQLDQQRRFITERLEAARATLNDLRARESMASEKRLLMENLVLWAGKFGHGLDDLPQEKRRDVLRLIVDQVLIDHDNRVSISLGIPTENFTSIEKEESRRRTHYALSLAPQTESAGSGVEARHSSPRVMSSRSNLPSPAPDTPRPGFETANGERRIWVLA